MLNTTNRWYTPLARQLFECFEKLINVIKSSYGKKEEEQITKMRSLIISVIIFTVSVGLTSQLTADTPPKKSSKKWSLLSLLPMPTCLKEQINWCTPLRLMMKGSRLLRQKRHPTWLSY